MLWFVLILRRISGVKKLGTPLHPALMQSRSFQNVEYRSGIVTLCFILRLTNILWFREEQCQISVIESR